MKFFVNENCIGCGLCTQICPTVFELADSGFARAAEREVTEEEQSAAVEAMESCPVEAIEEL